jgi:hypothetical protein
LLIAWSDEGMIKRGLLASRRGIPLPLVARGINTP